MDRIKHDMGVRLLEAWKGWWFYHRFVKKYHLQQTKICLIPSSEGKYVNASLLYLDQMLRVQGYDSAVILTVPDIKKAEAALFSDKILFVKRIRRKTAERIMQFYCLYDFDERLIVCSLEEPAGRQALGLVGKNGITEEEVFVTGVYGIPDFVKETPVTYGKKQKKILCFLENHE